MELNDKWNQQIAIERAQRDAESLEKEMQAAREEMRIRDEHEKKRLAELEEIVRQEKVRFIVNRLRSTGPFRSNIFFFNYRKLLNISSLNIILKKLSIEF